MAAYRLVYDLRHLQADCQELGTLYARKSGMGYLYLYPDGGAEYCDEPVCLSACLCLSVCDHIFGTTRPILTTFFKHVAYGRGSFLLWRRSDM